MEAKVILCKFFKNFNFELDMDQSFDILDTASLRPKGGAMVTLTLRSNWHGIIFSCLYDKCCYVVLFYALENWPMSIMYITCIVYLESFQKKSNELRNSPAECDIFV